MFTCGALMLPCDLSLVARAHALALMFYGLRLNAFLMYRELALPVEVHQMKKRDATLAERLKRAPVIIGCSVLYFCMAAPLRISALTQGNAAAAGAVALAFLGFGVAALGDVWKTVVKARKGADFLVRSGPFKWLRHPNYTGECFGWTASFAVACVLSAARGMAFSRSLAPWLVASALGWVGILFVLAGEATGGLEKKQREKYGGTPEYEEWVKGSWAGPMVAPPQPKE
jgi:steroid 5-alpha reductase family enzyme